MGAVAGPTGRGKRYKGPVRRTAAYLRVSSRGQDEALQREAITRAAAARGETVDLWVSEVRSGAASLRPELDALRLLARRGELSRLWVFRLDRLSRRGAADLVVLVSELRRHGCRLISVQEGFDFDGPIGEMVIAVLGAVAQMELDAQRERREAARAAAEARGAKWGRPVAATPDQRAQLRQSLEQGLTLRKAAKEAGLSYSVAQRIVAADRQVT